MIPRSEVLLVALSCGDLNLIPLWATASSIFYGNLRPKPWIVAHRLLLSAAVAGVLSVATIPLSKRFSATSRRGRQLHR
jgi:hypothetical protein